MSGTHANDTEHSEALERTRTHLLAGGYVLTGETHSEPIRRLWGDDLYARLDVRDPSGSAAHVLVESRNLEPSTVVESTLRGCPFDPTAEPGLRSVEEFATAVNGYSAPDYPSYE